MKRGMLALFLTLVSVNFVSAAFHYGGFSLGNLLDSIEPSTMVLGIIFIISTLFINTGLTRAGPFRDNKNVAGIISVSIALFIIWGVNQTGWNYYGFFNGILFFIPTGFLETLWPLLLLAGIVIVGIWKKWNSLYYIGGFLMIAGYLIDSGTLIAIGAALIITRFFWVLIFKKKDDVNSHYKESLIQKGKRGAKWVGGKIDPRNRRARYLQKRRIKTEKRVARDTLAKQKALDKAHKKALKENKGVDEYSKSGGI